MGVVGSSGGYYLDGQPQLDLVQQNPLVYIWRLQDIGVNIVSDFVHLFEHPEDD